MKELLLLLCLCEAAAFGKTGFETKINVRVVDGNGASVLNAKVGVSFSAFVDDGDPWKGQKNFREHAVSDLKGKCSFAGKSLSRLSVGVEKEGYYGSGEVFKLVKIDLERGRWVPYEHDVLLVLRKIKHPIPMFAWGLDMEKYPVTTNEWAGFDLVLADWVPPHGLGKKEDVRFQITEDLDGDGMKKPQRVLDIVFCGEQNGVQAIKESEMSYQSHYIFPYSAPKDGYAQKNLRLEKWRNEVEYKDITNVGSTNCFFRIRSKVDKDGNFVEGLYGKIRGPVDFQGRSNRLNLRFIYYVNPTPNDFNVEFDPEKNLIKKNGILKSVVLP